MAKKDKKQDAPKAKTKAILVSRQGKSTVYSPLVADRIMDRLSAGEPLSSICADDNMPDRATVAEWYVHPDELARPGFAARYERAERIGLHLMAEDTLNIADDSGKDTVTKIFRGKRVKVVDTEHIQRDKLRVETRKWILSKKMKSVFGDEVRHDHTGQIDIVSRLHEGRKRAEEARRALAAPSDSPKVDVSDVIQDAEFVDIDRNNV